MSLQNTTKNMGYDNPAYMSRGTYNTSIAAGSGATSTIFVPHSNLLLLGLTMTPAAAGTSTYTATQYYGGFAGTLTSATVHVSSTQVSLIRVTNTSTFGQAPAVSTSTIGPFYVDYLNTTNGTATGAVGSFTQVALNTSTGSAGLNGIAVNAGDRLFLVNGTDATAVTYATIDYQILPLSNVVA